MRSDVRTILPQSSSSMPVTGLAQVIVQTNANGNGPLILKVTAPGLAPGEVTIQG